MLRIIVLILVVSSCASKEDFMVYQDEENIYRYSHTTADENVIGRALRQKDESLIKDEDIANKIYKNFKDEDELTESSPKFCKDKFKYSQKYHTAIDFLKNNQPGQARSVLEELESKCENMKYYSHINYLYAYSYQLENFNRIRDKYLNNFLNNAESIFPPGMYQENSYGEKKEVFRAYRENAKNALKGASLVLNPTNKKHLELARKNWMERIYLPGHDNLTGNHWVLFFGYSTFTKGFFDVGYSFKTEYGEFIPIVKTTSEFGNIYNLLYRKALYKSPDRSHQTGLNLALYQWRSYNFTFNYYTNRISGKKITDEGLGKMVAYGGTYQFNNSINFMYQAKFSSDHRDNLRGSALFGYKAEGGPSLIQIGILESHSVIAWKLSYINIYYDFSEKNFVASVTHGLTF